MKVVALTGAGISKSAGIPTFEEVDGLKSKLSVEFKRAYPEDFKQTMAQLIDSVKDKEPTQAHKALADLQIPIITMNIDCLHQKAGSRVVLQIHGDYKNNNVVLYGEDIHYREESINLIIQTAKQAKAENDKAILLVIGTSMQTVFANILTEIAKQYGMQVHYINSNADQEVPTFLKTHVILHK